MKNKPFIFIGAIILILITIVIVLIFNNYNNTEEKTPYMEYIEKVNNGETFILYVKQTSCQHCKKFTPTFNDVVKDYKLNALVINLTEMEQTEKKLFLNDLSIDSTPTVLFFKNGIELGKFSRIKGNKTYEYFTNKLKQNGYINED